MPNVIKAICIYNDDNDDDDEHSPTCLPYTFVQVIFGLEKQDFMLNVKNR